MSIEEARIRQEQSKSIREQVVEHIAKFSLASLIGGIGGFFSNYFAALLLGPAVLGIWLGAKLVLFYGMNLHLGVQSGMHREVPILRGKCDDAQQSAIINTSFSFSLIVAAVVSSGVLLSTFILKLGPELTLILRFIAGMLFLLIIQNFYGILFRVRNEFGTVSRVTLIDGLGNLCSAVLTFFYGLVGFLGGQLLRMFATTCYSYWKSSHAINWYWSNQVLKSLIQIGFPIMLINLTNFIFITVDRMLILSLLDTKSLGFYSLGNLVFTPLLLMFSVSGVVMYTRFGEKYGETQDSRALKRYLTVPMENLALVIPIVVGLIYIALPLLVKVFLPEYVPGIVPGRILIFGLFFYAIAVLPGNMLLVLNQQRLRLLILLGSVLLNLGVSYMALKLGYGIVGVAAGTALAYLVFFGITTAVAMHYMKASPKELGLLLAKILGPAFYVGTIVLAVDMFVIGVPDTLTSLLIRTIIAGSILIALTGYLLYKALTGTAKGIFWSKWNREVSSGDIL